MKRGRNVVNLVSKLR